MADYIVQLSATKGVWAGDQASFQLTATVRPAHRGVPFPEGKRINFHFESGVFPKDLNNVGIAYLTIKFSRTGVFTAGAILEEDPDARDTCEVVIPEKLKEVKPPEKSPEEIKRDKARFKAETAEFNKRVREAEKEEKKIVIVKDILVQVCGSPGRYQLVIQVVGEHGGLPNRKLLVKESRNRDSFHKETDLEGHAFVLVEFKELERRYHITDTESGKFRDITLSNT